jgi:hypothetical protein
VLENTFLSLPRLVPSALPALAPFAFLCTQKWDSAAKVPRIPRGIPVLMLGGAQDEIVPPEHMRGLWALVRRRGMGADEAEADGEGDKAADGEGEREEKAWTEGARAELDPGTRSKYVEFEHGTHSECLWLLSRLGCPLLSMGVLSLLILPRTCLLILDLCSHMRSQTTPASSLATGPPSPSSSPPSGAAAGMPPLPVNRPAHNSFPLPPRLPIDGLASDAPSRRTMHGTEHVCTPSHTTAATTPNTRIPG